MRTATLDLAAHHVRLAGETDFAGWRDAARRLALAGVPPEDVTWEVGRTDHDTAAMSSTPTPCPSPQGGGDSETSTSPSESSSSPPSGGEVPSEARRRGGGDTDAAESPPTDPDHRS